MIFVKRTFVFALTILLTIAAFEGILRLSEISLPSYVQSDAKVGRTYLPNTRVMMLNEGFHMGQINEGGYLGTYYPPEKNPDAIRIALCGDSYVESFQLFPRYYFGSILEKKLERTTEADVQVLNFGRSGQDLRTMLIYYLGKVRKYNPDFTLFFISQSNLVTSDGNLGPYLELSGDSLRINHDFTESAAFRYRVKYAFLRNSALFSLFKKGMTIYNAGRASSVLLDKLDPTNLQRSRSAEANGAEQEDQYLEVNRRVFEELKKIDRRGETKVILVITTDLGDQYSQIVNSGNLEVACLEQMMAQLKAKGIDPKYWPATGKHGHWNHVGHENIAKYLHSTLSHSIMDEHLARKSATFLRK